MKCCRAADPQRQSGDLRRYYVGNRLSKAAQAVGWALRVNREPVVTPCHRVVNRFGKLAESFGGMGEHQRLLELERVEVVDGTVDLEKHRS